VPADHDLFEHGAERAEFIRRRAELHETPHSQVALGEHPLDAVVNLRVQRFPHGNFGFHRVQVAQPHLRHAPPQFAPEFRARRIPLKHRLPLKHWAVGRHVVELAHAGRIWCGDSPVTDALR